MDIFTHNGIGSLVYGIAEKIGDEAISMLKQSLKMPPRRVFGPRISMFIKKVIIVFLTGVYRVVNLLGVITHFDTFSVMFRYAKWKTHLKYLGENVRFYPGIVIHGCKEVSIRKGTCIAEYVHIWGEGGIEIGENVLIGAHSVITSLTHDKEAPIYKNSLVFKKVRIKDNVWIGTNAVILPGVKVGRNAIIGAGAVVTKDVGENDIVIGIPAESISNRSEHFCLNCD